MDQSTTPNAIRLPGPGAQRGRWPAARYREALGAGGGPWRSEVQDVYDRIMALMAA
jgi:hypothetical protein